MTSTTSSSKVALVTGSTSGIGLACVQRFAKRGVSVILTGSRDKSQAEGILAELRREGTVSAHYIQADLSKLSDIEALWSEVIKLYPDGIDILVNNAGILHQSLVEEFPDDLWDKMMAINLTAPFQLTKRSLHGMKKTGWGRIVNISSQYDRVSASQLAVLSATKHGLTGFTKGVALENAKYGITCNAVAPGFTHTPALDRFVKTHAESTGVTVDEATAKLASTVPTKGLITPNQVAELVEFLCLSNASSQMTGSSYLIDQGLTAQ